MVFSSNKNKNVIGVDMGSRKIKIVEITWNNDRPQLVTYGLMELDKSTVGVKPQDNIEFYAQSLKAVVQHAHATTPVCVGTLPALNAFTTLIEMPAMPKKELDSALMWEAKKLVPLPVEKMKLDWHILPTIEKTGGDKKKFTRIILTAAPKDVINNCLATFKLAGLQLVSLETELSALRRALIHNPQETEMIIDLGATNTSIVIYSQAIPIMNHNLDIGGDNIDINIANSLNVTIERARQFKKSFGPPLKSQGEHPVSKVIKFTIDNLLIREIRPLIVAYQKDNAKIDRITITGGVAHLKDVAPYIQQELSITTLIGNPWLAVDYPPELQADLMQIGPEMSVAIGLALHKI
jgi:type IV pilus assembly protein PilM